MKLKKKAAENPEALVQELIALAGKTPPNWYKDQQAKQCKLCDGTGWQIETRLGMQCVVGRCQCMIKKQTEERLNTLDDVFQQHPDMVGQEFWSNQKQADVRYKASGKGSLWLTGESGSGKSGFCHRKLLKFGGRLKAIRGLDIDTMFRTQNDDGAWVKYKINIDTDLLAIDDIDKRCPYTDAVKRDVYDLLDKICKSSAKLIVTANMNLHEFCEQWPTHQSEPLERRIRGKCEVLEL